MPHRRIRRPISIAAGLTLLTATAAAAAPVQTTPPKIIGAPVVLGTIGCDPGTWTGAVSVTRVWQYGRNRTSAAPTLRILPADADSPIICRVTATDAAGATTVGSALTVPVAAKMKLRYRLTSPGGRKIRLTGTAGPRPSLRVGGRPAKILLLHVGRALGRQFLFVRTIPANGRFDITTTDFPGRRAYAVVLQSPDSRAFDGVTRQSILTVKR